MHRSQESLPGDFGLLLWLTAAGLDPSGTEHCVSDPLSHTNCCWELMSSVKQTSKQTNITLSCSLKMLLLNIKPNVSMMTYLDKLKIQNLVDTVLD